MVYLQACCIKAAPSKSSGHVGLACYRYFRAHAGSFPSGTSILGSPSTWCSRWSDTSGSQQHRQCLQELPSAAVTRYCLLCCLPFVSTGKPCDRFCRPSMQKTDIHLFHAEAKACISAKVQLSLTAAVQFAFNILHGKSMYPSS